MRKISMHDLVVCDGCEDLEVHSFDGLLGITRKMGYCRVTPAEKELYDRQQVPQSCPRLRDHIVHAKRMRALGPTMQRLREL